MNKKIILFVVICQFSIYNLLLPLLGGSGWASAQNIGINATGAAPAASAGLDVDFTNKGLLVPRVALTAANSNAPIGASIATSLLVYNTATAGASPNNVTPGYYWWDGAKWKRFTDNDFLTYAQTQTTFVFAATTLKSVTVTTQAGDKVLLIGQWDFSKNATASWVASEMWRGATEIAENAGYATANADGNAYCHWVDIPGAGTWTYNYRYSFGGGGFSSQYGSMFYAIILKQ